MKNIHVLSTDKPSRLCINGKNQMHIYITSDEEIKEGDWVYSENRNKVCKVTGVSKWSHKDDYSIDLDNESYYIHNSYVKKIILTTDQDLIADGIQAIDDSFLEWFGKNPSCEHVSVQKRYSDFTVEPFVGYKIIIPQEEPKDVVLGYKTSLDAQMLDKIEPKQIKCYCGHTTYCDCGPEEPKQETLKEAVMIERIAMDKLKNKWGHLYTFRYPKRPFPTNYENDLNNIKIGLYEGAKYQAERMGLMEIELNHTKTLLASCEKALEDRDKQADRMYSEEEVLELIWKYETRQTSMVGYSNVKKWFEQFKKK
jgi:hypothetical protein